jgi:hypothetical protein
MAYDVLEKQIKALPPKYYEQVENFVQYIVHEAAKEQRKKRPAEISENMSRVYSKISEKEQLSTCDATLETYRALTQNDTW